MEQYSEFCHYISKFEYFHGNIVSFSCMNRTHVYEYIRLSLSDPNTNGELYFAIILNFFGEEYILFIPKKLNIFLFLSSFWFCIINRIFLFKSFIIYYIINIENKLFTEFVAIFWFHWRSIQK